MEVGHGVAGIARVFVGPDGDGETTISQMTQEIMDEPFDKRVAKIRACMHLTQKELAGRIGVTRAAVSLWENGKRIPSKMAWKVLTNLWLAEASKLDKRMDGGN